MQEKKGAAILTVGEELLLGRTLDTNAVHLAAGLAGAGEVNFADDWYYVTSGKKPAS